MKEHPGADGVLHWGPRVSSPAHLPTSRENLERIREIDGHHADPEICDHLIVYRDGSVLLTAYDAGHGDVYVTKRLPSDVVEWMRRIIKDED